jgi:hypothetical protein
MISNNHQNDNSVRPLISSPKSYCRHRIQEYIDENDLQTHPRWAPFTREVVSIALEEIKQNKKYCWKPSKAHLAIIRYLHNFMCPKKGWGYSIHKLENIGSSLNEYGYKKLKEYQTKHLVKELEILGLVKRSRPHRRSSYHTQLTTLGYALLVDNHP